MALHSTYHLQNSLPNRSPSSRPLSMSLADYQPLTFNREALEATYQTSLAVPASSTASWQSHPSSISLAPESVSSHDSGHLTLSKYLKAGDNPHLPASPPPFSERPPEGGFAGVGAGHSLTPPQSPFHKLAPPQLPPQPVVSPSPPLSPSAKYASQMDTDTRGGSTARAGRRYSVDQSAGLDMDDFEAAGYDTDPGPVVSGVRRRTLPQPPTDVPPPDLPAWEYVTTPPPPIHSSNFPYRQSRPPVLSLTLRPDYKPHIPAGLTEPSIGNAYAQLGAPPPNLPARRTRQYLPFAGDVAGPSRPAVADAAGPSYSTQASSADTRPSIVTTGLSSTVGSGPQVGAPEFPPDAPESRVAPTSSSSISSRPRSDAEKEVQLRATERTPIWSTHWIDPSLRNDLVSFPQQISNAANAALTSLGNGAGTKHGGSLEEMARKAREWVVPADGRFQSENGGIELGLGIIDSGSREWGNDKGRQRGRVEVVSRTGGIKVDIIEIAPNRQIDLKVETKGGDVLVLIPDNYHGPINISGSARAPIFLHVLQSQLLPVKKSYNTFFSTFAVPLAVRRDMEQQSVPSAIGTHEQAAGHVSGEQSKISITSQKGRVVIGYRESNDEAEAGNLGLLVGAQSGGKKRRWWK